MGEARTRVGKRQERARRSLLPLINLKPFLTRYRVHIALALTALLVSTLATLALPMGVRRMIDLGFSGEDTALVNNYFATLIVVGMVLAVSSAARYYFVNWLGERVVADLRESVFRHLCNLSPAFYEQTQSGEVMSRLTADTTQVKAAVGVAATQFLRNVLLLAGALIMMIVTSVKLSVLVVAAIPVIVLPLMAYGRAVRRLSAHAQDTIAASAAYAAENLAAVRTLQAYTHEDTVSRRFGSAVETAFDAADRKSVV